MIYNLAIMALTLLDLMDDESWDEGTATSWRAKYAYESLFPDALDLTANAQVSLIESSTDARLAFFVAAWVGVKLDTPVLQAVRAGLDASENTTRALEVRWLTHLIDVAPTAQIEPALPDFYPVPLVPWAECIFGSVRLRLEAWFDTSRRARLCRLQQCLKY